MENKLQLILIIAMAAIVVIIITFAYILPWVNTSLTPWLAIVLFPFAEPPASTVFILGLSLGISTLTQLVNRLSIDITRRNRIMAELNKFQELQKKAKQSNDRRLLIKVERKKKYVQKIQSEMMKMQFKPTLYFMIPFFVIFQLLGGFYGSSIVAILPFDLRLFIPETFLLGFGQGLILPPEAMPFVPYTSVFGIRFFTWYLLAGFGLSTIMTRLFGMQAPQINLN